MRQKEADVVVYISPLYYHNISAQLKTVIDRYHGIDDLIRGTGKKVFTIITAAYPQEWVFDGVKATVKTTARYLGWKDCGGIYAYGCHQKADIEKTDYPRQAYELGKNWRGWSMTNENCNRMVKFKCGRIDSSS